MSVENVSEFEMEEYRREYDDMECKNITFDDFMTRKHSARQENVRAMTIYRNLPIADENLTRFRLTKPAGMADSVPRTIIIDGPNVMHCGSTYKDGRDNSKQQNIPDVAALLSLMRFFVSQDFDVYAVISRKYIAADATNNKSALEELVRHNMCVITSHSNLDDTIALDLAAQVNGLVVTSDKYLDHTSVDPRYRRLVTENRLGIDWHEVKKGNRNSRTRKFDDFIAGKKFVFKNPENDDYASADDMLTKIFVSPRDIQYSITKERLDLARPAENREKSLSLLNRLIVDGITQCQINAQLIRNTPVYTVKVDKKAETDDALDEDEDLIDRYQDDDDNEW